MKGNKGITLIALVVTIIVLLILAGVAIAMLTGNNSILNRAQSSVAENELAEGRDAVGLAWNSAYADYLAAYYANNEDVQTFRSYLTRRLNEIQSTKFTITLTDSEITVSSIVSGDFGSNDTVGIKIISTSDTGAYAYANITDKSNAGTQGSKATLASPTITTWKTVNSGSSGN